MRKSLLFAGALGVGAGLMYILDPDRGQNRRRHARSQLQNYRHYSDDFLDQGGRMIGNQARHLWSNVRPSVSAFFTSPRDAWKGYFTPEPSAGVSPMLLLGGAAMGLGLLYFLDSRDGKERRAVVLGKAQKYWKKQQKAIYQTAENIGNRSREMIEGARNHPGQTNASSDKAVAERVQD